MHRDARLQLLRLLSGFTGTHVFNPWTERNADDGVRNGPAARRRRLAQHLSVDAHVILVGEATGYQGCRVTGIAFTSERLVIAGSIPRVPAARARLSTRTPPWSEPSATVVWSTLHELGIAHGALLCNAFPWHPHRPTEPLSNRTPLPRERSAGLAALDCLLAGFPAARVFAVGRQAEQALAEIGREATLLRHPSMGGAMLFRRQLAQAILSGTAASQDTSHSSRTKFTK